MRIRFTWIAAILALLAIGFLLACSSKYSASSNGLVILPSQGQGVMQTFSLDLSNGHIAQINNANGPPTLGSPGSIIVDPAGAFVYMASTVNCIPSNLPANTSLTAIQGAIVTYQIGSDGKLAAGTTNYLKGNAAYPGTFPTCGLDDATNPDGGNPPLALAIDSTGKFLFVATAPGTATYTIDTNTTPISTVATLNSPGISVFSIGSNASLTEVAGSPFSLPAEPGGGGSPSPSALAVTPTVFPVQFAPCSAIAPPTTEHLYVTDIANNALLNYSVSASGVLGLLEVATNTPGVTTGMNPSGVAVDPCNRFVYASNFGSNTVSAYTICNAVTQSCPLADYSLHEVSGSPYPAGDKPGPLAVYPFAGFLYVVDTGSGQVSPYQISAISGGLTAIGTPVSTNQSGPNSIALRNDGNWLFVANFNSSTVSQFGITPATGALTPAAPFSTFANPTGVAVK